MPHQAISGDNAMDRGILIDTLKAAICAEPWVQAAWMGGSEATGRTDDRSDVDLQVVVDEGREGDLFALAEATLDQLGGIARRWRRPATADADYRQCFYLPRGAPEHLMLDLCVMRADRLAPYLDPDRHGQPVVWIDRAGLIETVADPTVPAARQAKLADLADRLPMLGHIIEKELDRGDLPAAVGFYHALLVRSLVDLLRIRHCPERFDFGLRYLDRDLPADVRQRLDGLLLPADEAQLRVNTGVLRAWIAEELAATGLGSP